MMVYRLDTAINIRYTMTMSHLAPLSYDVRSTRMTIDALSLTVYLQMPWFTLVYHSISMLISPRQPLVMTIWELSSMQ